MNINQSTYLSVLIHMLSLSPYPAGLKSKEGIFEYANDAYRDLVNAPPDIKGLKDNDLPCDTAAFSDVFVEQDKLALAQNKTIVTIDVHNYSYGMDAYTFIKQPIIINGEPWGIQFTASKVKDWINMASFAEVLAANKSNLSFSTTRPLEPKLTPAQEIVLFWLLRGRQTKQIAQLIHRTPKAVEKQIANLVIRFACYGISSRAGLIEYARGNGWLSLIPAQLFKTPLSIIINNNEQLD
ncbi:LuxR family transcriptional regulator [Photobacterium phosphoreum]|mgnify:CR=1 FL=1|uniref:LuxR family transcriptional regulator n=1 Tax=Photobacterium phosphoreum TaxID=659 RepID=UPI001E649C68|nr:LuxR family transcriptional regulator [Photobacterium phosphoreum]